MAVGANVATPATLIFGVAGDTQGAVRVVSVRSQDLAFVEDDFDGVHMMVTVPHNAHTRLVFTGVRFVRILENVKGDCYYR